MTTPGRMERDGRSAGAAPGGHAAIRPRSFSSSDHRADDVYLRDPSTLALLRFFEKKTLATLKAEDAREQWYEDWLAFQAEHRLYASVLAPRAYSSRGGTFDLLRYTRFLEVFAYCSPSHGYSAQVTFLGLFAILMGSDEALKSEAVATLERGGLLAFGISEKAHGSDLLAGEFTVAAGVDGDLVANGSKYYIGNANAASVISILAKDERPADRARRVPFVLFALRPEGAPGFRGSRKIRTLGVRSAHVGEFDVEDHRLPPSDIIAEGRRAWDAVIGTVTLGKFFLGFGSIGICERAFEEAAAHLRSRVLYGEPVIAMPHIRSAVVRAWARLTAMKLYAYRALDYVRAANASDRRYQLYCAVQKAKVSTEGVAVMSLLSECVGARGFEAETYFEMALRDARLIPSLEGSAHINLVQTARFSERYFDRCSTDTPLPAFQADGENPFLVDARTGSLASVTFRPYLDAYRPLRSIANARLFARQARRFRRFLRARPVDLADKEASLHVGRGVATIAYAQLVAENARHLAVPTETLLVILHCLVEDLSAAALSLAALPGVEGDARARLQRMVSVPRTTAAEWDAAAERMDADWS